MREFKITPIFPTSIMTSSIGRSITQEERMVIEECSKKTYLNAGNTTSDERHILDKYFPEIREFIEEGIKHYVSSIIVPKNESIEFYITQSWLNFTEPGGYHHRHRHPNSVISGVFYFEANPAVDKITFFHSEHKHLRIAPKEWNWNNATSWWFTVTNGDLILFPSELEHMVETTKSGVTRISLAFNVFVRGSIGSDDELNALVL